MAPRLREDLVATTADDQGVACVEVSDPASGTSFRFYDFEYALAQQLTGQPLEQVVAWASATYGIELTAETLTQFLDQLAGLGFLAEGNGGAQPAIVAPYAPSPGAFATSGISPPPTLVTGAPVLAEDASTEAAWSAASVTTASGSTSASEPASAGPTEPSTVMPRLEVLASPLPPALETPASAASLDAPPPPVALREHLPASPQSPVFPTFPVTVGLSGPAAFSTPSAPQRAVVSPATSPSAANDTPLASIARALADAIAPSPGATEVGGGEGPPHAEIEPGDAEKLPNEATAEAPSRSASAPTTASLSSATGGAPGGGQWISDLEREIGPEVDEPEVGALASASRAPGAPVGPVRHASPVSGAADQPPTRVRATSPARGVPIARATTDAARPGSAAPAETADERRQPPRPEVVVMPPMAEPPSTAAAPRRGWFAFLAVLVIGGGLGAAVWLMRPESGPPAPVSSADTAARVHVVAPQPTTFHGWFETVGAVSPGQDETLSFRTHGRAQEILPAGTTFAAGESVARLQGAGERELAVNRLRSRIAYYEQLRDSSRADGSPEAIRQAEAKLAARKHELLAAQAALAELEIRPKVAGEIVQLLVPKGAILKTGVPVLRVRSTTPRATFALSADEATRARALSFCRLETIPGTGDLPDGGAQESKARPIDCVLPPQPAPVPGGTAGATGAPGPRDARFVVELPGNAGVGAGTQVRLASARYDGVFPVPQAAVIHDGDVDHVWIVSGGGRFAERRTVELASTIDALALIAHGLAVGDAVVVDPPATLKAGSEINVVR